MPRIARAQGGYTWRPPIGIPLPPGPRLWPLLGLMPEFRRDPLGTLHSIARDYGDLAYFRLGPQDVYFVNRPELVQDVLVTHASKFVKSRVLQRARMLLGEGLLTSEGEFHLRQRRLVQPAFHRDRLIAYTRTMVECGLRMRDRWRDGEIIDAAEQMTRLTLLVVAKALFSRDVEHEAADVGEALTFFVSMFDTLVLPYSEYLVLLPLPRTRRFQKARAQLDDIIYAIIRERRADGSDRGDLLSMLLAAQDEEGTGGMTDEQVRDEALTIFLAGHETTANALAWTWYLLSQHPEQERRLATELSEVLNGRAPYFDDLPRLRYTEMVFTEAMRLYPPAWAIGRIAAQDHELGGFPLKAGSVVFLSPYTMHRNTRFYPDPERFDPDRWTPEAKESRPKFAYFPFGGGPRVCIGERFAWMEGVLLLATLASKWRLRLEPGRAVEAKAMITLRPKNLTMRVVAV